jgi:hypothetical protein
MGRHYKVLLPMHWQSVGQVLEIWGADGLRARMDAFAWVGYAGIRAAGAGKELSRDLGGHGVLA